MTPAEKRVFRINATRKGVKNEILFLNLFDVLERSGKYDEDVIFKKIPSLKKEQLPNIKANLYRQILSSLRYQKRHTHSLIAIRENLDYAHILHAKGLYNAALDILDKTKRMASETEQSLSTLAALELEKHIEGLYITGSMYPKAKVLKDQTLNALRQVSVNHRLSNLSLSLYGLYLQYGYVKDDRDYDFISDYFRNNLPDIDLNTLDFYGKVYYYQSHVWYYNMIQDFPNTYKSAQRWVDLFINNSERQDRELTLYIKGLHNVLNSLFMAQRYDKFAPMYEELLRLGDTHKQKMNRDQMSTYKLIEFTHGINQFFLTGNFKGGAQYVIQIAKAIDQNYFDWDLNRIILFNYKIACIHFCNGDLGSTIGHLNYITNRVYPNFREDIQCFARILNLIAHFDLGNEALVTHQIKSTYRYLSKIEHLQDTLRSILNFVRRIPRISEENLRKEFTSLRNELIKIEQTQFERRPFLYLDIISWLESKIEDIPVGEVIRRKVQVKLQAV